MPAMFENGAFARGVPAWHRQGVVVDDPYMTTEQVLSLVPELASDVVACDLAYRSPVTGEWVQIADEVANVRGDDDKWLANVSLDYKIVNPRRGFRFMDDLIGDRARWETAGTLRGGREIFMLAQLDRTSTLKGLPDERHSWYLGLTNTYDTRRALTVAITAVRWVCTNTVAMGLASAPRAWTVAHTGDVEGKIVEARRTLELADSYVDAWENRAEALLAEPFAKLDMRRLLDRLTPFRTDERTRRDQELGDRAVENREDAKRAVMEFFLHGPDLRETAAAFTKWGAYNAVAEFADHERPARANARTGDGEAAVRTARLLGDHRLKDEALELLGAAS